MLNNTLIDSISKTIYDEFGNEYTIYSESIPQNFSNKSFYITLMQSGDERVSNNIFSSNNNYCIYYFPNSLNQKRSECLDVYDRLRHIFGLVTTTNSYLIKCSSNDENAILQDDGTYKKHYFPKIRGENIRYEIIDDVLSFFVTFNFDYFENMIDEVKMNNLNVNENMTQ